MSKCIINYQPNSSLDHCYHVVDVFDQVSFRTYIKMIVCYTYNGYIYMCACVYVYNKCV